MAAKHGRRHWIVGENDDAATLVSTMNPGDKVTLNFDLSVGPDHIEVGAGATGTVVSSTFVTNGYRSIQPVRDDLGAVARELVIVRMDTPAGLIVTAYVEGFTKT